MCRQTRGTSDFSIKIYAKIGNSPCKGITTIFTRRNMSYLLISSDLGVSVRRKLHIGAARKDVDERRKLCGPADLGIKPKKGLNGFFVRETRRGRRSGAGNDVTWR